MACTCHGCGRKFKVDIVVPNDVWHAIYTENPAHAQQGGGLLCAACIGQRIENLSNTMSSETEGYMAFRLKRL